MKTKNLTASTGSLEDAFEVNLTDKDLKAAYQKGLKDGEAIENVEVYSYNKGFKKGYQKGWRAGVKRGKQEILDAARIESTPDGYVYIDKLKDWRKKNEAAWKNFSVLMRRLNKKK